MADADYFLDLSSPDPLADDVPSSVRPVSRRITKQDLPSFSIPHIPQSSPQRGLRAQSPRKRTFQLDVGDERSPQRIRVTVEADDTLAHGSVNRKLFPASSSPAKARRRRETITTTTTTVPLNDEDEPRDDPIGTPRRRGRQRRTSNGTPMPRGRKRAGTPIPRKSKQARQDDGPSSETGILDDAPKDNEGDGGGETPKPKIGIRKTPLKPTADAPAPSSQISNRTTGRKRGRPRKVPLPEEPTPAAEAEPKTSDAVTTDTSGSRSNIQRDLDGSLNVGRDRTPNEHLNDHTSLSSDPPLGRSIGTASPLPLSSPQDRERIAGSLGSPTSSHQELAEEDESVNGGDYQDMELESDPQSAQDEDGMTHHRHDTIADASEFSMIAVESLPSFQASFQASFRDDGSQPSSDHHEMGEETSRIVNDALDSLRRSLQTGTESSSQATEAEDHPGRNADSHQDRDDTQNESVATETRSSGRALAKSPRRPKQLPLSRKVFVGRGNVDDSFSSIPDSFLHAAAPGRLPTKPVTDEHEHRGREDGGYDDSFSEIPEAALEAATPRPPRRVETSTYGSSARNAELHDATRLMAQRSNLDQGSGRLPTPEETSSSNAGSRQALDEDIGLANQDQPSAAQRVDVPSSPPIINRPRALDFGYSNLQQELNAVQDRRSSSPQRPFSSKTTSNKLQSLEAPQPPPRPSLSPIVRVGRTLQNVMSDNSSPEARERNLGSPFRGSMSSDYPHQSSIGGSPSPSIRNRGTQNQPQNLVSSPARQDPNFKSNLDLNFGHPRRNSGVVGNLLGQDNNANAITEPPRSLITHPLADPIASLRRLSMTGPARADLPSSKGELSLGTQDNSSQRPLERLPLFQAASPHNQKAIERHGRSASMAAPADDTNLQPEQDQEHFDESARVTNEKMSNKAEETHLDDENDDVDIWDIEASRMSSPGRPEAAQAAPGPLKSDVPQPRRSRVPSPWRRNNRRLIYKDDFASSSQIEIEESSQSEVDQSPPSDSRQQPLVSQPQEDTQSRAPEPEPMRKSPVQEERHERGASNSPNSSLNSFREHAGLAGSEEPDSPVGDEKPESPEQPKWAPDRMDVDDGGHETWEEPNDPGTPIAAEPSIDISEYSMVAQRTKEIQGRQEKPATSKPGLFGGFNLSSFFSSPVTLPTKAPALNSPGPVPVNNPVSPRARPEASQPKGRPGLIRSTGLFAPMQQGGTQTGAEQKNETFSPRSALQSTSTVADTYERSTLTSPAPSRSQSESVAPSTPERQVFPPSQREPHLSQRANEPRSSSPEVISNNRDETNYSTQENGDGQESHVSTDSSEYERLPPPEKLSRWDRHLSPTKSCFRSPLKPTTPGRMVAFSDPEVSSPSSHVLSQTRGTWDTYTRRDTPRDGTNAGNNIIPQGPPLRAAPEGQEDKQHPPGQQVRNANNHYSSDNTLLARLSAATAPAKEQPRRASASTSTAAAAAAALSRTTWSTRHWARLDEMLRQRRDDPPRFRQACALPSPDGRQSAALLGSEVSVDDLRLTLEPWHLDVVEAFKFEVGGWDEKSLAKRVFSLIMGWRRRAAETL
ncbi:hypothetical protein SAMD00023353_1601690 [Rosellinia necatrix]|uniref:Uncharacterized protein n=1 Tax=Rosellinia necatrix TaxID=77044 RepID=A0A1W2TI59_ROSNE|nr:hypothetical protein SAMD00023353_1601690 [Rosellinia necatrix]